MVCWKWLSHLTSHNLIRDTHKRDNLLPAPLAKWSEAASGTTSATLSQTQLSSNSRIECMIQRKKCFMRRDACTSHLMVQGLVGGHSHSFQTKVVVHVQCVMT